MPPLFLEMFLKRINALTLPAAELVTHLTLLNYCHKRKYNLTRKVFLNDQSIWNRSNT